MDYIKLLHSICTYSIIRRNEGSGGCIFFEGNSSIVQDRFCTFRCFTSSSGQHSFTNVKVENNKNLVNLSSLYQCGNDDIGSCSLTHSYGNKALISTNITNTKSQYKAGYSFGYSSSVSNFCYFISNGNHFSDPACMIHDEERNSFVQNSIFKNNSGKIAHSYYGLLTSFFDSFLTVSECIFNGNNVDNTFSAVYTSSLTIINCTGDILTADSFDCPTIETDKMKTDPFNISFPLVSLIRCDELYSFSIKRFDYPTQNNDEFILEGFFKINFSIVCFFKFK